MFSVKGANAMTPTQEDPGRKLMDLLVQRLIKKLEDKDTDPTASELEVVRKLLGDNNITLASVRRGDFGEVAREVAEEFPFQDGM